MFILRVSSTQNRNAKEYGKKFMFDGLEDSCWNSDQVCCYSKKCFLIVRGKPSYFFKIKYYMQTVFIILHCQICFSLIEAVKRAPHNAR